MVDLFRARAQPFGSRERLARALLAAHRVRSLPLDLRRELLRRGREPRTRQVETMRCSGELLGRRSNFVRLALHGSDQCAELLERAVEGALQKSQFVRISTVGSRREIAELRLADVLARVSYASNELRGDGRDLPRDHQEQAGRAGGPHGTGDDAGIQDAEQPTRCHEGTGRHDRRVVANSAAAIERVRHDDQEVQNDESLVAERQHYRADEEHIQSRKSVAMPRTMRLGARREARQQQIDEHDAERNADCDRGLRFADVKKSSNDGPRADDHSCAEPTARSEASAAGPWR